LLSKKVKVRVVSIDFSANAGRLRLNGWISLRCAILRGVTA
jgi:hypothetical protein